MNELNFRDFFGNGGEKYAIPPKWSQSIKAYGDTEQGYPTWWLSTQKMTPERKQQHFNAIVNNMVDDGYDMSEVPQAINGIVGYGENERNRDEFSPTLGFDKGDIESLLKNYNPNNFEKGGQYSSPQVYSKSEQKYGLPNGLLYNVARTESNFNPNAKSKAGAVGLMEFMPATAREFGIDPTNPEQSIDAAGKYLSQLIKQTGNVENALRAYNWGIGNVQKWKKGEKQMPLETQQYVGKVLGGNTSSGAFSNSNMGKYFNQIEQDLSWRSRKIDEEIEDEEIPQYTSEETNQDDIEDDNQDEDVVQNEENNAIVEQNTIDNSDNEYFSLDELSTLLTQNRRNEFLDIAMRNSYQRGEEYA